MADTLAPAQAPARGSAESPAAAVSPGSEGAAAGTTSTWRPDQAGERCPVCHGPTVAEFQRLLGQPEHLLCSGPRWVLAEPVLFHRNPWRSRSW